MFSYSEKEVGHALSNELHIEKVHTDELRTLPLTPPKGG